MLTVVPRSAAFDLQERVIECPPDLASQGCNPRCFGCAGFAIEAGRAALNIRPIETSFNAEHPLSNLVAGLCRIPVNFKVCGILATSPKPADQEFSTSPRPG